VRRLLRSPWFYYTLAGLLLVGGLLSQLEIRVPSRPKKSIDALAELRQRDDVSVVFLLIDTLRADHLGIYGYERDTSPTIDDIARFGVRFANVRSQSSWTKASMASLWASAYPARTGVIRYNHALAEEVRTPAEILRDAGFVTGGIFRNGWVAANFGFGQGFDLYVRPVPSRTQERYERARANEYTLKGTDLDATEAAIEFLRVNAGSRFFLYVHYMDVHQYLYEQNFAEFGTAYKDAYDNALKWTDYNVAMLVSALDELGLFEKTILVIGSDHGEAFFEHGKEGHAQDVYAEVSNVPFIVSLPFRLDQPVVVEQRVRNVDLWPTILDLLGAEPMQDAEGISLVPLIEAAARGTAPNGSVPPGAIAHLDRTWGRAETDPMPMVGLDEEGLRLIYNDTTPDAAELYDTVADPGEQKNIADERPAERDALVAKARAYLATEPMVDAGDVKLDAMQLDQLRALGYVLEDNEPKPQNAPKNVPQKGAK
jgi:arylsulfatase A-like enzyme